jgi:hypothetical protein
MTTQHPNDDGLIARLLAIATIAGPKLGPVQLAPNREARNHQLVRLPVGVAAMIGLLAPTADTADLAAITAYLRERHLPETTIAQTMTLGKIGFDTELVVLAVEEALDIDIYPSGEASSIAHGLMLEFRGAFWTVHGTPERRNLTFIGAVAMARLLANGHAPQS